ncbi:MAG TPA: class I SAM-dependent methyltransferase [Burkholderiaceae bacterium]
MMTLTEKATIMHYHRHRIAEFEGGTVEALGYRNGDSQAKRFAALATVGAIDGKSVLDVGCGHGDLKGYLDMHYHGFSYVGIDQMAEFVLQARERYGNRPGCYFCVADAEAAELPRADYVFASGMLAYRSGDEGHAYAMIEKMYRAADRALAFNMLDAAAFPPHPLLVGHDAAAVMDFCTRLTPDAKLVRGYLEDDFTVLMYK